MNPTIHSQEEVQVMYDLPCTICRRRKVRCSKTLSCNNCERAGATCTYTSPDRSSRRPARHTELSVRLSRIESLVKTQGRLIKRGVNADLEDEENTSIDDLDMQTLLERLDQEYRQQSTNPGRYGRPGKLAFVEGSSRHIHRRFWAATYNEIQNLKYFLEEDKPSESLDILFSFASPSPFQTIPLSRLQSDVLVQSYVQHVDPFVRVLHKPRLLHELNHYRRGIFPDADLFECQLFVIYALALIPMNADECLFKLGAEKSMLMGIFKHAVRTRLAQLNIPSSHKIRNLQTFILYLTLLFWTGEMAQASGLLSLAVRFAQRIGVHQDGSRLNLSPWRVEMRRRMWHQIVLIDSWCIENEGAETMIFPGLSSTKMPQSSSDSSWDACEFALEGPIATTNFNDMTCALVQYELGMVYRNLVDQSLHKDIDTLVEHQQDLISQARGRLETVYLVSLDSTQPLQKLVSNLTTLSFERMFLAIHQPLFQYENGSNLATPELQSEYVVPFHTEQIFTRIEFFRLFDRAIAYCEAVQSLQDEYAPHHLDWILVRALSWHSITIMLTNVLKDHTLDSTERGLRARGRITQLFQNRHSIDYLAGNEHLWRPLEQLWDELKELEATDFEYGSAARNSPAVQGEWLLESVDFDLQYPLA